MKVKKKDIPNLITLTRLLLALCAYFLILHTSNVLLPFFLTIVVIGGDFLDGYFARRLKVSSDFGAWFDIASDRFVEFGYWSVFAVKAIISPWILIIFLLRGILVDGIRSFAQKEGLTAFGEKTMMKKNTLAWFIVASPFSRFSYALFKAAAFCLCCLVVKDSFIWLKPIADILVYASTAYCIARGIPVLIEGKRFFVSESK